MTTPRRMWSLYEPVHVVTYFAPQPREAYEAAGLRGYWRGYFAGRSAPLGAVGAGAVVATFYGFAPQMVARALPDVWSRATPEATLEARLSGSTAALAAVLSDVDGERVEEAAQLLKSAAQAVDVAGRAIAAANARLDWPEEPIGTLWHAGGILREHRGDGHIAALLTGPLGGLDGPESVVWRAVLGGTREFYQPSRGWTDEEWDATVARLTEKRWLGADGKPTEESHEAYAAIEATTDRLAQGPWDALGPEATQRCAELLEPIATRAATYLPGVVTQPFKH
jgi:hypothetical protein